MGEIVGRIELTIGWPICHDKSIHIDTWEYNPTQKWWAPQSTVGVCRYSLAGQASVVLGCLEHSTQNLVIDHQPWLSLVKFHIQMFWTRASKEEGFKGKISRELIAWLRYMCLIFPHNGSLERHCAQHSCSMLVVGFFASSSLWHPPLGASGRAKVFSWWFLFLGNNGWWW